LEHAPVDRARLRRFILAGDSCGLSIQSPERTPIIGVVAGTGIGPEVNRAALRVLEAVEPVSGTPWQVQWLDTPRDAAGLSGGVPRSIAELCATVFDSGGAVLSGPMGGRFVYELRRQFGLFCKFVPVRAWPQIAGTGCLTPEHTADVDILIVRDNAAGVYQGTWHAERSSGRRSAEHAFGYTEAQVRQLMEVAARAAAARKRMLTTVVKDGGVPTISELWRDVATAAAQNHRISVSMLNIDLAAYQLIQHPRQFDVIVAPNLFGDVLADVAGVLQRSRALGVSANFAADGRAVYQTNHGCAHDLAGSNRANPVGQILALAMLLRESLGLEPEADQIERGVAAAWEQGWRTADLPEPGCRIVDTQQMTDHIVAAIGRDRPRQVHP
jgi:3-isopropylmalate dehydrogenase